MAGGPVGDGSPGSPRDLNSVLAARALEGRRSRGRGEGFKLRFKIQHMMWLSLWTALVLAGRDPLIASLPEAVGAIVWISGVVAAALVVGLYGVALLMEEGLLKDQAVLLMLYCLAGDLFLFLAFLVLEARR